MGARVAAALACVLALTCADGPTLPPGSFTVSVAAPPARSFNVGDTLRLEAEVRDQWGDALSGVDVAWSSSDERVASVGPTGVVTALAPGSATIEAASGGGVSTVRLSVADPAYAVLTALYLKTGGADWTNNRNWLSDADLGAWYGVEADGAGRVVGLDLAANNLTGHIPPELGDLGDLLRLDLGGNNLAGEVPPELGDLESLRRLDLAANDLAGRVPGELFELDQLEELELQANSLTGRALTYDALFELANLRILRLHSNGLTGGISSGLGNLRNLRSNAEADPTHADERNHPTQAGSVEPTLNE